MNSPINYLKKVTFFVLLSVCTSHGWSQAFKKKRHSITPMIGLANNFTTPFSNSPSANLRIDYTNGDNQRIPLSLRYQYRMKHGNRFGMDFLSNYNPLTLNPKYYLENYGFVGPVVLAHSGSMIGGDLHYSKTIDIKLIEVFGFLGIGGYWQFPDNQNTQNFDWYKDATPEFYEFAVASTHNSIKSFLPITIFGFGARFKHLEGGLNYQFSLTSPVNAFQYDGVEFRNEMRFRSLGYYVAYRVEF